MFCIAMDEMTKENTSKPLKFSRIHTVLIKIISKLNFKKVEHPDNQNIQDWYCKHGF